MPTPRAARGSAPRRETKAVSTRPVSGSAIKREKNRHGQRQQRAVWLGYEGMPPEEIDSFIILGAWHAIVGAWHAIVGAWHFQSALHLISRRPSSSRCKAPQRCRAPVSQSALHLISRRPSSSRCTCTGNPKCLAPDLPPSIKFQVQGTSKVPCTGKPKVPCTGKPGCHAPVLLPSDHRKNSTHPASLESIK